MEKFLNIFVVDSPNLATYHSFDSLEHALDYIKCSNVFCGKIYQFSKVSSYSFEFVPEQSNVSIDE